MKENYLRIVLPEGDRIRSGAGTRVFVGESELDGVESVTIHLAKDEIITATLRLTAATIENLQGLCTRIETIAAEADRE